MKTSVPDHGGKLIDQATDDMSMTHTPMRKREKARRSASRSPRRERGARPALPPQSDQQMDDEHE
jgi:hypothetical protein